MRSRNASRPSAWDRTATTAVRVPGRPVCLWKTLCRRKLPGTRRNSSGGWQKRRVKPATGIARRSRPSDRSESGYGKPLRRRGPPAEGARTAGEEARVATEDAHQAVVDAVRATADALNATLEQMKVVEEMRQDAPRT